MVPKPTWIGTLGHTMIYLFVCAIASVLCAFPLVFFNFDLKASNSALHKLMTAYGMTSLFFWLVLIASISYATGVRKSLPHARYWLSAAAGFLTAAAWWITIALGGFGILFLIGLFLPATLASLAAKFAVRFNRGMQPSPKPGAADAEC